MWIADEAAQASKEVPEGWEARADPRGNLYYTNVASGDSLREHPREAEELLPSSLLSNGSLLRRRPCALWAAPHL